MQEFCARPDGSKCTLSGNHRLAQLSVDEEADSSLQTLQQRFDRLSDQWYALTRQELQSETMVSTKIFFTQTNLSVWILEAGLAVVLIILFKIRLQLRTQSENIPPAVINNKIESPIEASASAMEAPVVEDNRRIVKTSKFVKIKVRKVSTKKAR